MRRWRRCERAWRRAPARRVLKQTGVAGVDPGLAVCTSLSPRSSRGEKDGDRKSDAGRGDSTGTVVPKTPRNMAAAMPPQHDRQRPAVDRPCTPTLSPPCVARGARLRAAAAGGARRPEGACSIPRAPPPRGHNCVRIGRPAARPAAAAAAVRRRHGDPGRGGGRGAHRPAASRKPALAPWRQLLHFRFQRATARQRLRMTAETTAGAEGDMPSRNGESLDQAPPGGPRRRRAPAP
jgi:hypothetical protein